MPYWLERERRRGSAVRMAGEDIWISGGHERRGLRSTERMHPVNVPWPDRVSSGHDRQALMQLQDPSIHLPFSFSQKRYDSMISIPSMEEKNNFKISLQTPKTLVCLFHVSFTFAFLLFSFFSLLSQSWLLVQTFSEGSSLLLIECERIWTTKSWELLPFTLSLSLLLSFSLYPFFLSLLFLCFCFVSKWTGKLVLQFSPFMMKNKLIIYYKLWGMLFSPISAGLWILSSSFGNQNKG